MKVTEEKITEHQVTKIEIVDPALKQGWHKFMATKKE